MTENRVVLWQLDNKALERLVQQCNDQLEIAAATWEQLAYATLVEHSNFYFLLEQASNQAELVRYHIQLKEQFNRYYPELMGEVNRFLDESLADID